MKKIVKQGAAAHTLMGSVALLTGPAVANSLHDEGDFGGGYRIIGPSGGPERYAYVRHHTFRPYYYGPAYTYDYGPDYYDYSYGPPIGFWGPGSGVVIGY
jgi:hypothetical protein